MQEMCREGVNQYITGCEIKFHPAVFEREFLSDFPNMTRSQATSLFAHLTEFELLILEATLYF